MMPSSPSPWHYYHGAQFHCSQQQQQQQQTQQPQQYSYRYNPYQPVVLIEPSPQQQHQHPDNARLSSTSRTSSSTSSSSSSSMSSATSTAASLPCSQEQPIFGFPFLLVNSTLPPGSYQHQQQQFVRVNPKPHHPPPSNRRMCRHYLVGKCRWGSQCQFSHGKGKAADTDIHGRRMGKKKLAFSPHKWCREAPTRAMCKYKEHCIFRHQDDDVSVLFG
eukprot:PhM_4_TR14433/c0_g1_i1/m.76826